MRHQVQSVPFGYKPPAAEKNRGTLIFYDTFEHTSDAELDAAMLCAEKLTFTKMVLYPLHEETVRRMMKEPVSALYKREKRLLEWMEEHEGTGRVPVVMEGWESKRKKYTPIDTTLRFVTEKYASPYFLYVTPDMANLFASFASFEEWIVKIRLVLSEEPAASRLHPKLQQYSHRWQVS
ncbi:hypothetical protein [Paenibacillus pini]|uniref:Uncharacterized protein n=1 Tax=Paenibacillus pini JCM 16418 TaxID=1236976 RepID=W7YUM1_9BACL|nr:hypothetical protein [Paenibacillus pini]GAF06134.1 hypothetical protein JCM16418_79 [Paenibacillus pini JCM 16418]